MPRPLAVVLLVGALTGLLLGLLVANDPPTGEVVAAVGGGHGLHTGDMRAVATWLVGLVALGHLLLDR